MTKTPEEAVSNKFLNIGTTPSRKYSPLKIISNLPSSKTKKWTTKFTKFQRNNEKTKINISSPLNTTPNSQFQRSVSTKSLNDVNKIENIWEETFSKGNLKTASPVNKNSPYFGTTSTTDTLRTESLPKKYSPMKSAFSTNFDVNHFSKCDSSVANTPERFPISRTIPSKSKKSFINEKCALCNELISNKTIGERILELECKHLCHEECLSVSIDNLSGTSSLDFHNVFPECGKCFEEKGYVRQCIPQSEDLKDRLLSKILINTSASSPITFQSIETPIQTGFSPLTTPTNQVQSQVIFQQSPNSISQNSNQGLFNISLSEPPMKRFSLKKVDRENDLHSLKFSTINVGNEHQTAKSKRTSLLLSCLKDETSQFDTDIISTTTSHTNNPSNPENNQLPIIRSFFTQLLLVNFKDRLTDWQLDEEFGLLRIVDRLLVSFDNSIFKTCWCFLFSRVFVVVIATESSNTSSDSVLLETKLSDFLIFDNLRDINVQTINSSTLLISEKNIAPLASEKKIYLKQSLVNNASNILQKWISGLLDKEMIFNKNNITSTLKLPLILKNVNNEDDNESNTYTSLINPSRIMELSTLKRSSGSIFLRRSILVEKNNQKNNPTDTLLSMKTSVSSILSFKRKKPDELFVVLQLDFNKLRDRDYYTIVNSLKALNITLPLSKVCVVNQDGCILKSPFGVGDYLSVEDFKEWALLQSTNKMEPLSLRKELYPPVLISNIGIVVISNSAMKEESSCLMKDFSCFSKTGRHTPNQLKIKVGYLNVDYSSKIDELFEVDSWDCVLETICYSYNINFEEDDDRQTESILTDKYSFNNDSSFFEKPENNDGSSIITLEISTPIVTSTNTALPKSTPSLNKSINEDTSLEAFTNVNAENSLSSEVAPDNSEKSVLSKKTDMHGIVLNQIDRTIEDIRSYRITDVDSKEKKERLYNYI